MPSATWAVNADGIWSDAADWNPLGVPTAGDDVTINTTDLHTVTHGSGTDIINSLTVGNDNFVVSGGSLTLTAPSRFSPSSSFGQTLTISGGTLNLKQTSATAADFVQSGGRLNFEGGRGLDVTGSAFFSDNCTVSGKGGVAISGSATVASGAIITLGVNTGITFYGTTETVAGALTGGFFETEGGETTLESGATISTAHWAANGGVVHLGENLTYAGDFSMEAVVSSPSMIRLGGYSFALTGPVSFGFGATVTGAGGLVTSGVTRLFDRTVAGVTLGAGVTWTNSGSVTQQGTKRAEGLRGKSSVINQSAGVYDLAGDTGIAAASFVNQGLLEKTAGAGFSKVATAVANSGTISVATGTMLITGAVTGAGGATIAGGALHFGAAFDENVLFSAAAGGLVLARSQAYGATISGFAGTGRTYLDLRDIGFVKAGEATFSGTSTGGTLTVTDGTHLAQINLTGNYLSSNFQASSDSHGGVIVVALAPAGATTTTVVPHRFIAAMAGFAPQTAAAAHIGWASEAQAPVLARPHGAIA
ncbi:MAG TPA: hypothetical protein VII63_04895 [Caulobacteraceae bacterium]